jgi:hypothetical protein
MGFPLNYSKLTSFIKKKNILEQEKRKRNGKVLLLKIIIDFFPKKIEFSKEERTS